MGGYRPLGSQVLGRCLEPYNNGFAIASSASRMVLMYSSCHSESKASNQDQVWMIDILRDYHHEFDVSFDSASGGLVLRLVLIPGVL